MSSVESGIAYIDKGKSVSEEKRITIDEKSLVFINRRGVVLSRKGRGYSNKEITQAFANIGLKNQNISKVRAFNITVDKLRKSAHPENVDKLTGALNNKPERLQKLAKKRVSRRRKLLLRKPESNVLLYVGIRSGTD